MLEIRMFTASIGPQIERQLFVFRYSMQQYNAAEFQARNNTDIDLSFAGYLRTESYFDCARLAHFEVTRLINEDMESWDHCFRVGMIPLCNDAHILH